jgi:hypothetical protein
MTATAFLKMKTARWVEIVAYSMVMTPAQIVQIRCTAGDYICYLSLAANND